MTRQGSSPGHKPRRAGGNGPTPERDDRVRQVLRAKATRWIRREVADPEPVLAALGLVEDPVLTQRRQAKALADISHKRPPAPPAPPKDGYCERCANPIPKSGVCRKTLRCRDAADKREIAEGGEL